MRPGNSLSNFTPFEKEKKISQSLLGTDSSQNVLMGTRAQKDWHLLLPNLGGSMGGTYHRVVFSVCAARLQTRPP
jgi:hypothetical protein